ncbi:hypothetical protein D3C87_1738550 [compost metagenome]
MQAQHPFYRRLVHRPVQRHAADQSAAGADRQRYRANQERQAHRVLPVAFGALAEALMQSRFSGAEQCVVVQPFTLGQAFHFRTVQLT